MALDMTPFFLHALAPLHVGCGDLDDTVDQPIMRMQALRVPIVPGSSLKGVLRDADRTTQSDQSRRWAIFGPDHEHADDHSGALTLADAHLWFMPVRSFSGVFAWVTSPLLMRMAARDLPDLAVAIEKVMGGWTERSHTNALGTNGSGLAVSVRGVTETVVLEDHVINATPDDGWTTIAKSVADLVQVDSADFTERALLVDDTLMSFFWETATQVDVRIRVAPETGTVATGALWSEESLPAESILIGRMAAIDSRKRGVDLTAAEVLDAIVSNGNELALQVGGHKTVGRGLCRFIRPALPGGNRA